MISVHNDVVENHVAELIDSEMKKVALEIRLSL